MNKQLTNLVAEYKNQFGTVIENGVSVDKQLKLALNQILAQDGTVNDAMIATLYDVFHAVKGEVINKNGLYKKTKYFNVDETYFEIFIMLNEGKLTHGINFLNKKELKDKVVNYII